MEAEYHHPLDAAGWPIWPHASEHALERLREVLESGRWSISGPATTSKSLEREAAEAFAGWIGSPFCIPTCNGTGALVAALDALDIGGGDEVIVPGLTWTAPAVAVLQSGARPVLVDIDPDSLCIDPAAIRRNITARTRAVIVVHAYASMADIDLILEIARTHDLRVIEDGSQSHGTVYRGTRVGNFGDIGVFSLHQGKPLTCGEGGVAVTRDRGLAQRLEQARANGRRRDPGPARPGNSDLIEVGELVGTNLAMSEFHAAILLDALERADAQLARRAAAARLLDEAIGAIPGLRPISRPAGVHLQSYYQYVIRYAPARFGGLAPEALADLLSGRLGCRFEPTYVPLARHRLLQPATMRRYAALGRSGIATDEAGLSNCEAVHATAVIVHHRVLLADAEKLAAIPRAFGEIAQDQSRLVGRVR